MSYHEQAFFNFSHQSALFANLDIFPRKMSNLVKKVLFSCEFGHLSQKDDQFGKKSTVFL